MASQSPVRGNACWGILNAGRDLGHLRRWLTEGQAAVVRVVVTNVAREIWTGAVQNHSNREKVAWVSLARIHVSLLLAHKLDEGN